MVMVNPSLLHRIAILASEIYDEQSPSQSAYTSRTLNTLLRIS
jgi:hypothetical protein